MNRSRAHCAVKGGSAFTLVELIITLAILAFATALVTPMFSGLATTRLRSAARMLLADLEYAQFDAVAHPDDPRLVVLDEDGGGYCLTTLSDVDTPLTHPTNKDEYRVTFGAGPAAELTGVWISQHNLGDDRQLAYTMFGQLESTTDATITLAAGDNTLTLTIDADTGTPALGQIQ